MPKRKSHYVNYQQRAKEFSVGDTVFPFMFGNEYAAGKVTEVYPAIGVVEVEFSNGTKQFPVEDLQRMDTGVMPPDLTDSIPGGAGGPSVPGGPPLKEARLRRIAEAFVKKSIYWASKDRKYRATQAERESDSFTCPKCKKGQLRGAVYKRSDGVSDQLFGCPNCLFLIKKIDIIGHPDYREPKRDPLERMRILANEVG